MKSTQNSQSVKKRAAHDSMKKFQIAEQQKYNRTNGSKFAWIFIKNFAMILPSQPLLGHHLGFHNFLMQFFFCSLAVFV